MQAAKKDKDMAKQTYRSNRSKKSSIQSDLSSIETDITSQVSPPPFIDSIYCCCFCCLRCQPFNGEVAALNLTLLPRGMSIVVVCHN